MTVHKMTSQKEAVAAALQFYQCIKVYDGLVGWLVGWIVFAGLSGFFNCCL